MSDEFLYFKKFLLLLCPSSTKVNIKRAKHTTRAIPQRVELFGCHSSLVNFCGVYTLVHKVVPSFTPPPSPHPSPQITHTYTLPIITLHVMFHCCNMFSLTKAVVNTLLFSLLIVIFNHHTLLSCSSFVLPGTTTTTTTTATLTSRTITTSSIAIPFLRYCPSSHDSRYHHQLYVAFDPQTKATTTTTTPPSSTSLPLLTTTSNTPTDNNADTSLLSPLSSSSSTSSILDDDDEFDENDDNDNNEDDVNIDALTSQILSTPSNQPLSLQLLSKVHYVMDKWAKCGLGDKGAIIVERLLYRVVEELTERGNDVEGVAVSTKLYTIAIDAWARTSPSSPSAPLHAHTLLTHHQHLSSLHPRLPHLRPNQILYNSVINVYAQRGTIDAARSAEAILLSKFQQGKDAVKPNTISYNAILHAWAKCGAWRRALRILEEMIERSYEDVNVEPDGVTFNTVLLSVSKAAAAAAAAAAAGSERGDDSPNNSTPMGDVTPDDDMGHIAEQCLRKMVNLNIYPDAYSYYCVIMSYQHDGRRRGTGPAALRVAEKATTLYREMISRGAARVEPYVCNAVINAVAKYGSAERAETLLLNEMMDDDDGGRRSRVGLAGYNAIIHTYARRGDVGRVLSLLKKMTQEKSDISPDVFSYASVIHALSKKSFNNEMAPRHAERILRYMEQSRELSPNTVAYTSAIDAYAQRGDGVAAERLFRRMERSYYHYNNTSARPNVQSWNTVIKAWSRTRSVEGARRAKEIVLRMEELFLKYKIKEAQPNVVSYTTVVNAFGLLGMVEESVEMFERMEVNGGCKANKYSYTALIDAWLRSGSSGSSDGSDTDDDDEDDDDEDDDTIITNIYATTQAESILRSMTDKFRRGDMDAKPNKINFTTVINAIAKTKAEDAGRRATDLLLLLEGLCKDYPSDDDLCPSVLTYGGVINAIAKSREKRKARRAYEVLKGMEEGGVVVPNVYVYGSVLNACAYATDIESDDDDDDDDLTDIKTEAARIATMTLDECCRKNNMVHPNHVTYATYLRACLNLMENDESRKKEVMRVFHMAKQDGYVSKHVFKLVEEALGEQIVLVIDDDHDEISKNRTRWQAAGRNNTTTTMTNNNKMTQRQRQRRLPREWTRMVRRRRGDGGWRGGNRRNRGGNSDGVR